MEELIRTHRKEALLSPEIRIRRATFNKKRLKTQPSYLRALHNKPLPHHRSRMTFDSVAHPQILALTQKETYTARPLMSRNLNSVAQNKMVSSDVSVGKKHGKAAKSFRNNLEGYRRREIRMNRNQMTLDNIFGKSSNCHNSELDFSLGHVVGKIGKALMQRVPKIRYLSEQVDEYLSENKPEYYWPATRMGFHRNS